MMMALFPRCWMVRFLVLVGGLMMGGREALAVREVEWRYLSSKHGELPLPGDAKWQTAAVVGDFDNNGWNDFVVGLDPGSPALVWYRRSDIGWTRYEIESGKLSVAEGGAAFDVDRDGDLDLVFGAKNGRSKLFWWENPSPDFEHGRTWVRRTIREEADAQYGEQIFWDFKGIGRPQLVFWDHQSKALFMAELPADPKYVDSWPVVEIAPGKPGVSPVASVQETDALGLAAFDVDADGKMDLIAGDSWFKYLGGDRFKAVRYAKSGGRIAAGKFKPGRYPQIVIAPGDESGPLKLYECRGHPESSASWVGQDLLDKVVHGHSLQVGDINSDGRYDIFCAEMAKWSEQSGLDHPEPKAWILYGTGTGQFQTSEMVTGHGWHEGRLSDLDGDGDLDLLNKPYGWEVPRIDVWLNLGR